MTHLRCTVQPVSKNTTSCELKSSKKDLFDVRCIQAGLSRLFELRQLGIVHPLQDRLHVANAVSLVLDVFQKLLHGVRLIGKGIHGDTILASLLRRHLELVGVFDNLLSSFQLLFEVIAAVGALGDRLALLDDWLQEAQGLSRMANLRVVGCASILLLLSSGLGLRGLLALGRACFAVASSTAACRTLVIGTANRLPVRIEHLHIILIGALLSVVGALLRIGIAIAIAFAFALALRRLLTLQVTALNEQLKSNISCS